MSRKYLTQWAKAAEEWQDANNNMLEAVEEMIRKAFNEFCKDDEPIAEIIKELEK